MSRVLAFLTDAYGGRGGMAQFNRELLEAIAAHPRVHEVVAMPRFIAENVGAVPRGVRYDASASRGNLAFLWRALGATARDGYDGVICGHIIFLPLALLAAWRSGAPVILVIHGVEAWSPPRRALHRAAVRFIHVVTAVSEFSLSRFVAWSRHPADRTFILPNCVDASRFGPAAAPQHLRRRYGLDGRRVLLTVARLSSRERYKGVDELLELMPTLHGSLPELSYLIVGDGDDRARLQEKARNLGVADAVVFAGYVSEEEKADHYRLADVFAMPGHGEGFGIVYLEALATGVPVIGSTLDASREALLNGALGTVVDPRKPEEIREAILAALQRRQRVVPAGLSHFSREAFRTRCHQLLDRFLFGSQ